MGPMIDVFMPRHGKLFTVHRAVLQSRCHLLEQAFCQYDEDGDCVGLSLPSGTPEAFAIILKWIYTQAIHYIKDETEVSLYIDATNIALTLGIWDVLEPLCDRVETFYARNTMGKSTISAIENLPDDCKLHATLVKLAAAVLCDSARPYSTRSLADFESFVLSGSSAVLSLVKELAGMVIYEEDMNYGLVRRLAKGKVRPRSIEACPSTEDRMHTYAHDYRSEGSQVTLTDTFFTVIASNFAIGTTEGDIETRLAHDSIDSEGSDGLLSCKITSDHPLVTAELCFSERAIADHIVKLYNGYHADGEVLSLVHK